MTGPARLAVVTTHPIQYYAPWFRWVAGTGQIDLKVFYLWDTESEEKFDPGFQREVRWDLPLLDGYEHEFVPNTSTRPGTGSFWGIRNPELLTRLKLWRPDAALLIGYRYPSFLRLIFTPKEQRGFPLIFRGDSHRLAEARQSRKWKEGTRKWFISRVYSRFAAFTYVGRANKEYFRIHGVPEEKLFFAPHAVDNGRFLSASPVASTEAAQWRDQLGIPRENSLILFAGKFEEKKRPLDLLRAFRAARPAQASLLFVGNGPIEDEVRKEAREVEQVFFAPFQNQSAMPRTYAAADLFVLPSYGPEESWGLAVNEALAMGKAVVASSHVGCGPDLVQPGENGLIFEAGNIAALSEALREALQDRERLRHWGEAGREIVRNYDYAHATEGLLKALDYVL